MHFTLVKVLESSGNLVIYMLKLDLLHNDRILILIKLFLLSVWDEYCHVFEDNPLHSFSFMLKLK